MTTTIDTVTAGLRTTESIANGTALAATDDGAAHAGPLQQQQHPTWAAVLIVVACSAIMTGTVVGNLLVCIAVSIVRKLRTPSNWLIVSLAVADLLVALLVMPLAVVYEVEGRWTLGGTLCDVWTSCDVMLCTASILNLCMISVDRYFVISQPFAYAVRRTPAKMAAMILAVWLLAAIITIPPIFGWKGKAEANECQLSQVIGYQIYATLGAFYAPLVIMIVIYCRIYVLSARLHRVELRSKKPSTETLVRRKTSAGSRRSSSFDQHGHRRSTGGNNNRPGADNDRSPAGVECSPHPPPPPPPPPPPTTTTKLDAFKRNVSFLRRRPTIHRLAVSRERKATKTLGVIMGAFTACWLPFFIVALIRPFLTPAAAIPRWLDGVLQWLGFANSFFNPIIYARFNRDFRTPFKEILFLRCVDINVRVRSESYTEQFGTGDGASAGGGGGHRGRTAVTGRNRRTGSVIENSVFAAEDDGVPVGEPPRPSSKSPPEQKNGNGS